MIKCKPENNKNEYKFEEDKQTSLGYTSIRIPIKGYKLLIVIVDGVPVDLPFLIGLYFLDEYKMYLNTVGKNLCGSILHVDITLTRKHGHIYVDG